MFNKSIAYRLSIYVSLSVIAVFIAFVSIYFLFNVKIIKENIETKAVRISDEVISNVRSYVVTTTEITENIADQIGFYSQRDAVYEFIGSLVKKYPYLNAIHIHLDPKVEAKNHDFLCFEDADSLVFMSQNGPITTCLSTNANYQQLLNAGKSNWSEPMLCERNNTIVVSYYTPIYSKVEDSRSEIIGEVVCDLSLLQLSESINKLKVGDNGFAFLVSKNGTYITHPIKEWILKRNIADLSTKVFKSDSTYWDDLLNSDEPGFEIANPEIRNYEKSWIYHRKIKETGWILIQAIPYKEMFEPLFLPILKMLFFSVLGILIIYILITYITNRQIQPLSELTSQLKRLSSLSGESFAGEDTMNEIQHVSQSLNLLKSWYERNKIKVSREEKLNKLKDNDIYQAAEIQQSLIKFDYPAFPNNPELDLYTSYKPARVVSGDLFDYFFQDEKHLIISIGDVSGKGVPAAFFMSVAQTVIKSVAVDTNFTNSSSLVERVNEELYSNNVHQFFLTLFLGILNIETGKLSYCNAAHTASFVLKANGNLDMLSETHGLPLGLYRGKGYQHGNYTVQKGDSLILYTDGVTELRDENGEQYGISRLQQNLKSLKGLNPKEMVTRIEKSLQQFMGESTQNDDICILVLRYDS